MLFLDPLALQTTHLPPSTAASSLTILIPLWRHTRRTWAMTICRAYSVMTVLTRRWRHPRHHFTLWWSRQWWENESQKKGRRWVLRLLCCLPHLNHHSLQLDTAWEEIVCGRTSDQQSMTEAAKSYLTLVTPHAIWMLRLRFSSGLC